jgi:hypothetical protein
MPIKPWALKRQSLGVFEGLGDVLDARDGRKAQEAKAAQTLEDRLAQQKTRGLQDRTLEQALEDQYERFETSDGFVDQNKRTREIRPLYVDGYHEKKPLRGPNSGKGDAVNWQTVETSKGLVQVNPRTGETRPLGMEKPPAAAPSSFSFPVGAGPDGKPVVLRANNRTGEVEPTDVAAKVTGANARLTEAQEKSYLFNNLMKNAEPEISAMMATKKIRPAAVSAYLAAGDIADIPILGKAIGAVANRGVNAVLNSEEQRLIRAGKDFTAGVLRKESGAAVSNKELMETFERYFPGMFGDKPELTDAKNAARGQYMQAMEHEAGPATEFYGRQAGTKANAGSSHGAISDADFARAWAAGKRTDADITAWIAANPKRP